MYKVSLHGAEIEEWSGLHSFAYFLQAVNDFLQAVNEILHLSVPQGCAKFRAIDCFHSTASSEGESRLYMTT